jgi:hypothetical protein
MGTLIIVLLFLALFIGAPWFVFKYYTKVSNQVLLEGEQSHGIVGYLDDPTVSQAPAA